MADTDLQTLRLFLSTFELRNLRRAAERHHIAASAVTTRLRALERHYGVTLFERRPRGVEPTYAGEELARHVRDLLARLNHIEGSMSEFSEGARGQVRVHASASTLMEGAIASIVSFTRAHPAIRIELAELMSWSIVRNVAEGRADLGLMAGSAEVPPDLATRLYRTGRLMMLAPSGHALAGRAVVAFEELLDLDHVGIGSTSALSLQLAEEAGRLDRVIRHAYRVSTYDVAREFVAKGAGIAILPESLVLAHAGRLGLACIPLSDAWALREMRLCYREEALTVASRTFVGHLLGNEAVAGKSRGQAEAGAPGG